MSTGKNLKIFIFISFLIHLLFILTSYRNISRHYTEDAFIEIDLINLNRAEANLKIPEKITDRKKIKNLFSNKVIRLNSKIAIETDSRGNKGEDILLKDYPTEYRVNVNSFIHIIREKIEKVKSYPELARTNNYTGEVHLRFSVASSGEVKNIMLIKSSGFSILDESAVATVRKASPFLPFPDTPDNKEILVSLPIIFALK